MLEQGGGLWLMQAWKSPPKIRSERDASLKPVPCDAGEGCGAQLAAPLDKGHHGGRR